ncbi:hypothetical protein Lfu02_44460 [Longispora fulva]|uniref:Uncharacterized protein n=1 Tax=Longispora fulva TaxID=619741 RepID=A0A8J7GRJ9_9ACTN|nr:hypothetical protein [Longispora fulva]MBG6136903.1 hypothetical protein [Longispora fulva]GIG60074.1 hypothetical protein Lfu02_44460 [Longispora fulva]
MTEVGSPTMLTKMRAFLHGEKDTALLEAMRQAGRTAYEELLTAERLRAQLAAEGLTVWQATPAVESQFLATWNAYVLQILGEAFLDADYAADPGTVGYVPPVTLGQVSEWFSAVEGWLSRARQARVNPDYDLAAELGLPAALPPWVEVTPCPPEHLAALLAAIPPVREHAEVALHALESGPVPKESRKAVNRLRQMTAEAAAAVDYALGLRTARHDARLHELIENNLKQALELWFAVGQLAAMPRLLDTHYRPAARPDLARLPGGPRFDPWALTDPASLTRWQRDSKAVQAVREMWQFDPDPAATLALKDTIDAALRSGDIAYYQISGGASCYFECPWPALFEVRRPVRIGGVNMKVLQQFTIRVSADDVPKGRPFIRKVVTGPFRTTNEIDYCDPDGRH